MEEPIKGQCFCGDIQFEVRPPVLFFVHCHCEYCRKAQGAAFVSWVGFDDAQFRYILGGDRVNWYKSTEESRRGFCSHCGSTMFYRSSIIPGEIHIARPYLLNGPDRSPDAHVFYDRHVDWFSVLDDLEKVTSDHEGLAKYHAIKTLK